MQPTTKATMPVKVTDRILYLDILRGIAILFIFLANITYLSGTAFTAKKWLLPFQLQRLTTLWKCFFFTLIDGKFYSIFSALFGIGFVQHHLATLFQVWTCGMDLATADLW